METIIVKIFYIWSKMWKFRHHLNTRTYLQFEGNAVEVVKVFEPRASDPAEDQTLDDRALHQREICRKILH